MSKGPKVERVPWKGSLHEGAKTLIEEGYFMSKHTPGPFELEECGCCGSYHRLGYEGDCRNDAERFPTPDALENLWRAAPDMLKALEELKKCHLGRGYIQLDDGMMLEMRAAIAKAKGEA